jgi:hypothetical protein
MSWTDPRSQNQTMEEGFVKSSVLSLLALFTECLTNASALDLTPVPSHTRFSLTLRSKEGEYHSLILFRLSSANHHGPEITNDVAYKQLYAMEAACPHLGADMSHADIEDYCGEDGEDHSAVIVCRGIGESRLHPVRRLIQVLTAVTAIGMILTWPLERARH